ncbi:hypothetical protein MANES_04G008500v8 [Manihot esculenta]|uniref:Uncharacterized protein n=1 Tax=Manihot esculenta TaxID=3983 RepID=A0A2C9VYE6_MANES|nr:hypothetical protein MANES_04G008500v8 [Manihot esculenta]
MQRRILSNSTRKGLLLVSSFSVSGSMASYQVRDSSRSIDIRRGFSKSQMCLHKILRIIASYPPQETSRSSSLNREIHEFDENKGLGIDLNVEICPWPETEASECLSSCSVVDKVFSNCTEMEFGGVFVAEKSSSEGECDLKEVRDQLGTDSLTIEAIAKESRSFEVSEAINLYVKQKSLDGDEGVKTAPSFQQKEEERKENGCFSLLIEAAEMASRPSDSSKDKGDFEKESEADKGRNGESSSSSSKRSDECFGVENKSGDFEDTSPVVRSKRGRSQVLPLRYRDSILLLSPSKRVASSQRPAAAPMVSTKRGRLNNNKKKNK